MRLWMLCALLLCVHAATQETQQAPPADEAKLTPVELDAIIEQLPPVAEQWTWSEAHGWVSSHPGALRLRTHIAGGGTLSDEQWKHALLRSDVLHMRERWPADQPLAVGMHVPAWLSFVTQIRAVPILARLARPEAGRLAPIMCGNWSDTLNKLEDYQYLGKLPLGRHELIFQCVVERGTERALRAAPRPAPEPGPPAGILWTGELSFGVEIVPSLSDVLPMIHDEGVTAQVRGILEVALFKNTELVVHPNRELDPELTTTALSLEIELMEGGVVRGTEALFVPDRTGLHYPAASWDMPPTADLSQWSVRVRGTATDVLRSWRAERYWDGVLEIPLTEAVRR